MEQQDKFDWQGKRKDQVEYSAAVATVSFALLLLTVFFGFITS
jgi:hypothetical protein